MLGKPNGKACLWCMDGAERPGGWIRRRFGGNRLSRMEVTTLTEMLNRLELAQKENGEVSVDAMLEASGRRSFGPMLLVPGLLILSPLSGVPGVPTLAGVLVLLITVQLLAGRNSFWLPQWILRRSITYDKLVKGIAFLRPIAKVTDKFLRPRITWLTQSAGIYVVAAICLMVAIALPPLELVPFAATSAGVALTLFGLALIGHDGLVTLLGITVSVGAAVFLSITLL